MSKKRYPPEYIEQVVALHRTGRSIRALGREFEPSEQTIRNWIKQADLDTGRRRDELTTEERDELRRLRRENKTLKLEREILKNHLGARLHVLGEKLLEDTFRLPSGVAVCFLVAVEPVK